MNLADARIDQETSELVIGETIRLPVPTIERIDLADHSLIVGIRPEHLRIAKKETVEAQRIYVNVTNVEVLGNETIFSFMINNAEWLVKWSGQWHIEIGDTVPLELDFASLCIFSGDTEQLI
ncbi:TOBE domain-containing protein, partial [Microvirga sp. 3-52]|nr:TOBE domain-containing protein [Microvirga sp. 3-52]